MKRIIVPTDFSSGAWNALLYALELGQTFNVDELLILNAYYEPHSGAATMLSIHQLMKDQSEKDLQKWQQKIEEKEYHKHLNIEYKSIHADLVSAINSQIKEPDQLVVMGTLGETGALEKLMGSNASSVVDKANGPVLVVPPDAKFTFRGKLLLAGDTEHLPDNIDTKTLKAFCDYHTNSKLEVVQVLQDGEVHSMKAFETLLKDIPYESHHLTGENVADTLDEYVTSQPVDILVMLKIKRSMLDKIFHRSVTKKLTMRANIPILILKETGQ